MTALLAALGLALLLGHVLDRALFADPADGAIDRFGRALMLGLGALGSVSLLADAAGLGVTPWSVFGGCALVLLACARPAWRHRVRRAAVPTGSKSAGGTASGAASAQRAGADPSHAEPLHGAPPRGDPPHGELPAGAPRRDLSLTAMHAALLLFALLGTGLAVRSGWVRPTFQFDSTTRWMFKTKALYYDGTLLGQVSTDPEYGLTHQRYPPLVSHVSNVPCLFAQRFDDRLASSIYVWFGVALVAVVYGALRRRSGRLCGAFGAMWVAQLPLFSYVFAPPPGAGAASAMADVPLALFFTGAAVAAADALEGRRQRAHLEAGLLLGFALLTKNEGMAFLIALCLGVLLAAPRARWRRTVGIGGLAFALFTLGWGWIAAGLPVTDEHYPGQLNLEALQRGLGRLAIILPRFGREFLDFPSWNVTWPAIGLLLLVGGRRCWRLPACRLLLVALVVQMGSYLAAYVITAWSSPAAEVISETSATGDPVSVLMSVSLGRLFMQVAPLAIVLALCASPVETRPSG